MKRASFAIAAFFVVGMATVHVRETKAQEPALITSRLISRVNMAGAFDARNKGRGDDEMYLGLASLEWQTNLSGLSLRLDGIYARRDWISRREPVPECNPMCPGAGDFGGFTYSAAKVTAAGAMFGATYNVISRHSFRPYVLASAGVVRTNDKFRSGTVPRINCTRACTLALIGSPGVERNARPLSAAGQVGLGAAYSIRWVSLFAEARYMTVDYAYTRGLNGAVPISLGFSVGRPARPQ